MGDGQDGVLNVDIVELRVAAGQMDGVFSDVNTALTGIDAKITGSSRAWTHTAKAAFVQFSTYIDARRDTLLGDIATIADNLVASADRYEGQDAANADAVAAAGNPELLA